MKLSIQVKWAFRASLIGFLLTFVGLILLGKLPRDGLGALLREPAGKVGLLLVVLWVAFRRGARRTLRLEPVGWRALGLAAAMGLLNLPLSQAVAVLTCLPLALAGAHFDPPAGYEAMHTPLGVGIGVVSIWVGVAIEELMFRGYVLTRLEELGSRRAIIVAAFLFAFAHVNFLMFPWAFVLGAYAGVMAWRTGSILPGLVAHGVGNTIGILSQALPSERYAALVRPLTEVGPNTLWIFIGAALTAALSLIALTRLVQAFMRTVPACPEPTSAALQVPANVVARSVSFWVLLLLLGLLNVAMTAKMFRGR